MAEIDSPLDDVDGDPLDAYFPLNIETRPHHGDLMVSPNDRPAKFLTADEAREYAGTLRDAGEEFGGEAKTVFMAMSEAVDQMAERLEDGDY